MRRTSTATSVLLKATVTFLLFTQAQAADVSGAITDLLLRKLAPDHTLNIPAGVLGKRPELGPISGAVQVSGWDNPPRLEAGSLIFYYFYELGKDYWFVYIPRPRLPLSDYLGTGDYKLAAVTSNDPKNSYRIYRINGGRFKGFILEEGYVRGKPGLLIFTPQIVTKSPNILKYLK